MVSALAKFIGGVESGNNPNAPLTDYAGNSGMTNAQYQQFPAFIAANGGVGGAPAVDHLAGTLLANNPNATLGDYYTAYNHGSVMDFGTYSQTYPTQAANFNSNAAAAGYNQNTPLSSLTGDGSGTGDSVTFSDPNQPNDSEAFPMTGGSGATGASQFDSQSGFGPLGSTSQPSDIGTAAGQNAPGLGVGDTSYPGNLAPSSTTPFNPTTASDPGVNAPTPAAATAPSGKSSGGGGTPTDITADPDAITAANTEAKAATGIGTSITGAESAAATAGTNWLTSIFGSGTSVLVRGGFILAGLVILGGAFLFFYIDANARREVVNAV